MWCHVVPLVEKMPEDVLCEIVFSVAWWLDAVSKSIEKYEDDLFALCSRLLHLYVEPRSGMTQEGELNQSPVTAAINHPVGLVTQALLSLWFIQKPNDNDQLPTKIAHLFTQLCDIQVHPYRHGRVILASRLIALYRVDQSWTEQHLLPLFRWAENPMEAQIAWQGFLWSPRLYQPLLIAFKPQFLETANHYEKLGELGQQYAAILTYAALENSNDDEVSKFQFVFETLPRDGLEEAARTLAQAVESAGEQSEDYWTNRIQPFWMNVWPKSKNLVSDSIAESLALMSIASGAKFSNSLDSVYAWLKPIEHPHYVLGQLNENNLCKLFPDAALRLLNVIIQNQQWSLPELGQCLTTISQEIPEIQYDSRYQRLTGFASEFDPN